MRSLICLGAIVALGVLGQPTAGQAAVVIPIPGSETLYTDHTASSGGTQVFDFGFQVEQPASDGSATVLERRVLGSEILANLKFVSAHLYEASDLATPIEDFAEIYNAGGTGSRIDGAYLEFANLNPAATYVLRITAQFLETGRGQIGAFITVVPLPGAGLLLASGLVGLGLLGWRHGTTGRMLPAA